MIPSKIPKGTTLEQWEAYEKELQAHNDHYEKIKPKKEDYARHRMQDYYIDIDHWSLKWSVNMPNKPGSEFSNND